MQARHAANAAILVLLAACGTVESTKMTVGGDETLIFDFQDHRPPPERMSARSGTRGEVLTRLGDESITPPGPVLLRSWLHNKGPAALEGRRVVLQEFLVHVYEPPVRAHPAADAAGLLGLLVGHGIAAATSPKNISVRISGTVDGQEFTAYVIRSLTGRVSESHINSVMREALDSAVASIGDILAAKKENAAAEQ
jgi:hypothetical protein